MRKYELSKANRIQRIRSGKLTDIEQRVLGVVLRPKDGAHISEVVSKSMEVHKTVEFVLMTLRAAGRVGHNGYRGPMARWCKPGREQHCREVAYAKFYAGRADPISDARRRISEVELRKQRRSEQYAKRNEARKAELKASPTLNGNPVRIIGPAREFKAPGPISVFHLGQQ